MMRVQAEGLYPNGDKRLTGVVISHSKLREMLVGQTIASVGFDDREAFELVLSNGTRIMIEAGGAYPEEPTVNVIIESKT